MNIRQLSDANAPEWWLYLAIGGGGTIVFVIVFMTVMGYYPSRIRKLLGRSPEKSVKYIV